MRPFVKWDDDPVSPQATVDAILRAHQIAGSAPTGPTYVTIDAALQETEDPGVHTTSPPTPHAPPFIARAADLEAAARTLLGARFPVVVAGGVGLDARSTPLLVDLVETLGTAGRDERNLSAFPTSHPLCFTGDDWVLEQADVLLAVDVHDVRWLLARTPTPPNVIDLSVRSLALRSWANVDHVGTRRITSLVSDPIEGLVALLQAVKDIDASAHHQEAIKADRLAVLRERRGNLDAERSRLTAEHWNDRPISTARLVAETYRDCKVEF